MTETCSYCYKVMPFGLKNAGATYQRLMDKVLAPILGRNVQAYVDDMVVTSQERGRHTSDLKELFAIISKYRLKLNPEKCVFGVEAGKFLGFMLTERGIEANPDKCAIIIAMRSPTSAKEVQQLTRRMAALSKFASARGEKGHPYFQCLKRNSHFAWTDECEAAFLKLKDYLAMLPFCAGPRAGSSAEAHLLCKQGFARPGVEVPFVGEGGAGSSILGQEAPPLFSQLHSGGDDEPPHSESTSEARCSWKDGSLSSGAVRGSGAGIVLEGPNGVLIEQALRFAFKANNNQAEYEALIAGMLLAKEMGAQSLLVKSDSQLVTGQVTGEYQAKDPQMAAYLKYVQVLKGAFATFELVHVVPAG
ncbi:uncharacterized protein [Phaseolus vulgaris]|uniref:uncharacterized protein n=1 Tax=Phaseolus vulgaris TaxID=3885 RepID=UPI0035CBD96B